MAKNEPEPKKQLTEEEKKLERSIAESFAKAKKISQAAQDTVNELYKKYHEG